MTTKTRATYHHGDLRAALVAAAAEIIEEVGIENFSLREAARRAGVAPSAPAYHFGTAKGLLTEVAILGYERLGEYIATNTETDSEMDELARTSLAYIKFALANSGLFRLMFRNDLVNREDERYRETSYGALQPFAQAAEQYCKAKGLEGPEGLFAVWSTVHGAAHLVLEKKAHPLFGLTSNDELVSQHLPRIISALWEL